MVSNPRQYCYDQQSVVVPGVVMFIVCVCVFVFGIVILMLRGRNFTTFLTHNTPQAANCASRTKMLG